MSRPAPRTRLTCEALETRENPTALLTESFDSVAAPRPIPNWSTWGNALFATSRLNPTSGLNSLASNGTTGTSTRTWFNRELPVDAPVAVEMLSDNAAPMLVFARGRQLASPQAQYVAARLGAQGQTLELLRQDGATTQVLAQLHLPQPAWQTPAVWYQVILKPSGSRLSVAVQRLDIQQFLSPQGTWQSTAIDALSSEVPHATGLGQVGLARAQGGNGMVFFENFRVDAVPLPPASPPVSPPVAAPVLPPVPPVVPPPEANPPQLPTAVRESFDTTALRTLPTGWSSWVNDRSAGFQVQDQRASTGTQSLTQTGLSNTTARAWITASAPADVQASADLWVDSLIPSTLFVRGDQLDTTHPSYYGLSVTRGTEIRLIAMVDGVSTTLGTLRSQSYLSGVWLKLSLTADGDRLRASVSRVDNGQFLGSDGRFSEIPQPALELTDRRLPRAGRVGVARPAQFAGQVTWDQVQYQPFSAAQLPNFELRASQPGTRFRDAVHFETLFASGADRVRYVEFALNGKVRASGTTAEAKWSLDTTLIPNGAHELVVRVFDELGNTVTRRLNFETANANATPPRATLPQKLSHIRIAQLVYASTPFSDFEAQKIQQSVDLVIPNTRFTQSIESIPGGTQQLLYSNVSNLYGSLLLDWLRYADRVGADREAAFYHVTKPTPWQGGSPSSQAVQQLWSVVLQEGSTATDLTAAARGGRSFGVRGGAAGSSLQVGYPDRFFELNWDLSAGARGGWSGVWEYPTAVDAQGRPTGWKPLQLTEDLTQGLRQSGVVRWTVPSDWVSTRGGAAAGLYEIRLRTTLGTAAEAFTAKTIFGRDYVQAQGGQRGIIPAFDFQADRDGDGYLNDAEYAQRGEGKDARFAYEARLFYPYYGQMRFVTNPSTLTVRQWAVEHHRMLLQQNPTYEGLFLDNSNGRLPFGDSVVESTRAYSQDYGDLITTLRREVPGPIFANTAGGFSDADSVTAASTGVLEEFLLRPTEANWANFTDVANLVQSRLRADAPSPYVILDSHPGSFTTTDDRVRSGTLAYYYLLADPERTMLMFFGGNQPSANWRDTWIAAAEVDVGRPTEAYKTFAQGTDPQNARLQYRVYSREYDKALVLYKPRSYTQAVGTGTTDEATATTHELNGSYRVLRPDGTLGPVVTRITLRNGEGVTLMKA